MTKVVQFNFNNEADILELRMNEETGEVTIPAQEDLVFESMDKFAEYYAMARNVSADRLKNWVLTNDGNVYTYSLRAATAGVSAYDIREELENAIQVASDDMNLHPLEVVSFRNEIMNAHDVVDALASVSNRELSRAVYDHLEEAGALTEEEYDELTPVKEYMDEVFEKIGSYAVFAHTLNMDLNASKDDIVARVRASEIEAYDFINMVNERVSLDSQRANASPYKPELLSALLLQAPVGVEDEAAVRKIRVTAQFARRDKVNIRTVYVGARYVKDTAEFVSVDDLSSENVRTIDGNPVVFSFDTAIDAEVEAELTAAAEEAEQNGEVEFEVEEDFDVDEDFENENY